MDMEWQKQLVDQMIAESPDYTVKDFIKLRMEISEVEEANEVPEPKASPKLNFTQLIEAIDKTLKQAI